jgi:hypothetical protein
MSLLRFERKGEPLAPRRMFVGRVLKNIGVAAIVVFIALLIGMVFYLYVDPTASWHQAFHRAAMILSGMGAWDPEGNVAKVFAGIYALFCGRRRGGLNPHRDAGFASHAASFSFGGR